MNPESNHGTPNPDELMNQMDANNDGKLSSREMNGPLQDRFNQLDVNSDGYLTKDELNNGMGSLHGQGEPTRRH